MIVRSWIRLKDKETRGRCTVYNRNEDEEKTFGEEKTEGNKTLLKKKGKFWTNEFVTLWVNIGISGTLSSNINNSTPNPLYLRKI
jgi:hypothetical protein